MRILTQPHECESYYNGQIPRFCKECGILMSSQKASPVYYRSLQYNMIDLYRVGDNSVFLNMVRKQSINWCYNPKSSYLNFRTKYIARIKDIGEEMDYTYHTFQLGVAIFDACMSKQIVDKKHMDLICFTALHLAGKLEESPDKVKNLSEISQLLDFDFNENAILKCETAMIKALGFNLNLVPPYFFVEYFLSRGLINQTDVSSSVSCVIEEQLEKFEDAVTDFIEIALNNYDFYNFDSVLIAAASVSCARRRLGFTGEWSQDMTDLTSLKYGDVKLCSNLLFSRSQKKIMNLSKVGAQRDKSQPIARRNSGLKAGQAVRDSTGTKCSETETRTKAKSYITKEKSPWVNSLIKTFSDKN